MSKTMFLDRDPDIPAGKNAGTKTVRIGNEKKQKEKADMHFPNLLSFASWLTD